MMIDIEVENNRDDLLPAAKELWAQYAFQPPPVPDLEVNVFDLFRHIATGLQRNPWRGSRRFQCKLKTLGFVHDPKEVDASPTLSHPRPHRLLDGG